MLTKSPLGDKIFVVSMVCFVGGSFGLAIADPGFRPEFAQLAQIAISGFIGWMAPRS